MSSSAPDGDVYQWHEEVEDLEEYREGGFHPVSIDDELDRGRYKIIHKLGYGTFSTVWLARDVKCATYVAVKIEAAFSTEVSNSKRILEDLKNDSDARERVGKQLVQPLLDTFSTDGPNGRHQCFVTKPARCSLALSKEASDTRLFPVKTARAIAAQLVLGISYLHSHGIVHGDLHLGNMLLYLPSIDELPADSLYCKSNASCRTAITRLDGAPLGPEAPKESIIPKWLGLPCEKVTLPNAAIWLGDFGEAFRPDSEERTEARIPRPYRPPESILGNQVLGFSADIWSLACLIYEVLGERSLFEILPWYDETYVLQENIEAIGKLPTEWAELCDPEKAFIGRHGESLWDALHKGKEIPRSLADRVNGMGRKEGDDFAAEEQSDILDMLSRMLIFRPSERIDAEGLTRVRWMQNWGMPAVEEMLQAKKV